MVLMSYLLDYTIHKGKSHSIVDSMAMYQNRHLDSHDLGTAQPGVDQWVAFEMSRYQLPRYVSSEVKRHRNMGFLSNSSVDQRGHH